MRGFSTPTKWNLVEFGVLSIVDIADIIVGTGPYIPLPLAI